MADADDFAHLGMPTPLARVIAEAINDTDGGEALVVAEQALGVAQGAESAAADAEQTANDALDIVEDVSEALGTAVDNAALALSTANDAATAASGAVTTANNAADQAQSAYDYADTANTAAGNAQNAANAAQNSADAAQETADEALLSAGEAALPFSRPSGAISETAWNPKQWTNTNSQNISLGVTMSDMTNEVTTDAQGNRRVRLGVNDRVSRKIVTKKRRDSHLLMIARVIATGVSGSNSIHLGVYYGNEGNTAGGLTGGSAYPLVEGANVIYRFVDSSLFLNADSIRPYMLRPSGNNAGTTVDVRSFQVIEITGNTVPLLAFNPPLDGTTDASAVIQAAVDAAVSIPASAGILDMGGRSYSVASPIIVSGAITIRNAGITAIGTRDDWSGGSQDSEGVPRQMGIFRCRSNNITFESVTLNGGVYEEWDVEGVPNTVYTMASTLANGFEDDIISGTNKPRNLTFHRCRVVDWADYGFRYSRPQGGGFNLLLNSASKDQPRTIGLFRNADHNLGCGVLIDASDGKMHDTTIFGGEWCIRQLAGNGTFELVGNHPWMGASAYNRRYYGTQGTIIETGIQIRTETQIGAYNTSLLSVTRRASDWQVIVELLDNIDIADAEPVIIRRDEIAALMEGWGSSWEGNYIDGGTVRCTNYGLRFSGGYGLPGAMNTPVDGIPGTMVSVFEFQPGTTMSPPPFIEWDSLSMGSRLILYPAIGQTSWNPETLRWTEETLASGSGHQLRQPAIFENYQSPTGIAVKSKTEQVSMAFCNNGATVSTSPSVIFGTGDPEAAVAAPVSSLYMRTDGAAGTTMYVKEAGSGNTGWVAK